MIPTMVEWQRKDKRSGLIQPWLTHPALDEIEKWDLFGKTVLEWGGGWSTVWWASRAKRVVTLENKAEWCAVLNHTFSLQLRSNGTVLHRTWLEVAANPIPEECPRPDIAVVDGVARDECVMAALKLPRPLILICDNWRQDEAWPTAPETIKAMEPYESCGEFFVQENHKPGFGNKWTTAIWWLS